MPRAASRAFSITSLTRDILPRVPFTLIKKDILGDAYDLSLVIVGDAKSRALNKRYRGKTYTPNVLSFPLGPLSGEMFLNLRQARRECREREQRFEHFVALLFVHGCLHLKGMRHGRTMENEEMRALLKRVRGYRT